MTLITGFSRTFAAAGPPQTNLTAQWDASDASKIWQTLTHGNNPCWSTAGADGQLCKVWQSTVPGAGVETPLVIETAGREPRYRIAASPMPAPSLLFVDTDNDDLWIRTRDDNGFSPLTNYLGLSAKTILISLQIHVATASGYIIQVAANDSFGMYVNNAGGNHIGIFNRHNGGTADNQHAISLDTNYVCMLRHDGVNIMSSLNGGAETSLASGASFPDASDTMRVGTNGALPTNMSVGEILLYNACLTGSNLAAAIAYMVNKWT